MNKAPFLTFITQLKEHKLSRDKFYFLKQAASAFYFFNGDQLFQIALCFPHSTDKKEAVAFLERRLATDISCETAANLIKSASFSRDRLGILQILVGHLKGVTDNSEQRVVISAFDFFIDKDQAWSILAKQCEIMGGTQPALPAAEDEIIEYVPKVTKVRQMAQDLINRPMQMDTSEMTSVTFPNLNPSSRLSIFDLPIMSKLTMLRQELPLMEAKICEDVKRRRETGQNFVIPSRVWAITTNLKPGRRLALAELESPTDAYPGLPDVVPDTDKRCSLTEQSQSPDGEQTTPASAASGNSEIESVDSSTVQVAVTDQSTPRTRRRYRKRVRDPMFDKISLKPDTESSDRWEVTQATEHEPVEYRRRTVEVLSPGASQDSSDANDTQQEVVTDHRITMEKLPQPMAEGRRKTVEVLSAPTPADHRTDDVPCEDAKGRLVPTEASELASGENRRLTVEILAPPTDDDNVHSDVLESRVDQDHHSSSKELHPPTSEHRRRTVEVLAPPITDEQPSDVCMPDDVVDSNTGAELEMLQPPKEEKRRKTVEILASVDFDEQITDSNISEDATDKICFADEEEQHKTASEDQQKTTEVLPLDATREQLSEKSTESIVSRDSSTKTEKLHKATTGRRRKTVEVMVPTTIQEEHGSEADILQRPPDQNHPIVTEISIPASPEYQRKMVEVSAPPIVLELKRVDSLYHPDQEDTQTAAKERQDSAVEDVQGAEASSADVELKGRSSSKTEHLFVDKVRSPVVGAAIRITADINQTTVQGSSAPYDHRSPVAGLGSGGHLVAHPPTISSEPASSSMSPSENRQMTYYITGPGKQTYRGKYNAPISLTVEPSEKPPKESATIQPSHSTTETVGPLRSTSSRGYVDLVNEEAQKSVMRSASSSAISAPPEWRYYPPNPLSIQRSQYSPGVRPLPNIYHSSHSTASWRSIGETRPFRTTSLNTSDAMRGRALLGSGISSTTGSRLLYQPMFSKPDYRISSYGTTDNRYQSSSSISRPFSYGAYRTPSSRFYYTR